MSPRAGLTPTFNIDLRNKFKLLGGIRLAARTDIRSVLVIGSGPIVIGQACEFDYSGTQACRVLSKEGYRVILANSNPATIMTDPDFADATYIEPLTLAVLEMIIAKERPDALLPTLGGQTALNLAMELNAAGVLERYGVEMIGANALAINTAENRELFKNAMDELELRVPRSGFAHDMEKAISVAEEIGFPVVVRPSFILGGAGTGIALDSEEFLEIASFGLSASPISEILIEESIAGWKEFELEVMRDRADNAVIVCSIENFDPMGVHTGDSITVAPAQTLSDVEYQMMRDAAFRIIRRIGVETGGSNIQFAIDPTNGEMVVIEMNPRVSRSSALASKATGFPIAKIATLLAIGYRLDEIENDITKVTPASFEPSIDYVVVKVPRWAFEKFPGVSSRLGTRMQSVGEAMAIGRTFTEALQKAMRSIELGRYGLGGDPLDKSLDLLGLDEVLNLATKATPSRIFEVESALRKGASIELVYEKTKIDPWFLFQIRKIVDEKRFWSDLAVDDEGDSIDSLKDQITRKDLLRAKRNGFSDAQLGYLTNTSETLFRELRSKFALVPGYKTVDTCAAEFEATTPYHYSSYDGESEATLGDRKKVIILGSGPNRIGQGIEFDYCCVHASYALSEAGYETIMLNCNPETVSTDYDTSDKLYLEPLFPEDLNSVIEAESSGLGGGNLAGIIVSLGGQTPLRLAQGIDPSLILGTSADAIDIAEDRKRWSAMCESLSIPQPPGGTATTFEEASKVVAEIGFPVLVRPSYVLGGRAMEIVYDLEEFEAAFSRLSALSAEGGEASMRPVLIDSFLEDAIEIDVDAIRDQDGGFLLGGIMEHVEEAGIHSGDSACVIPPITLPPQIQQEIVQTTAKIADALLVVGLINVQFALKAGSLYVIEANPRASRTVPFVSKATGVPLVKIASLVMVGRSLKELASEGILPVAVDRDYYAVKEAVMPFSRFPSADTLLGPEMRSTGEVMGIDSTFALAFAKSQLAAGTSLPSSGKVFLSLADRDKASGVELARRLRALGFSIAATSGTAKLLSSFDISVDDVVGKIGEAQDDELDAVSLISSGEVGLVINTPRGRGPRSDGYHIRSSANRYKVACVTTMSAALAGVSAIEALKDNKMTITSIQEFHRSISKGSR